jgi:hypothetical protein
MLAPAPLPLPLLLRISMPLLVLLLGICMPGQQLGMGQLGWVLLLRAAAAEGPLELGGQHCLGATAAAAGLPEQPPAVLCSA